MSGGHWDYLSRKLEERAEYAGNVWKLLAAIEHELDWGICGDTCYECAKIRAIRALEAFFNTEATDESTAVRLLRSSEPECEDCKQRSKPQVKHAQHAQLDITFEYEGKVYKGVAYEVPK